MFTYYTTCTITLGIGLENLEVLTTLGTIIPVFMYSEPRTSQAAACALQCQEMKIEKNNYGKCVFCCIYT